MSYIYCVEVRCRKTKAKAAVLHLNNTTIHLPVFMPVGTKATIKGLSSSQVERTGCRIILHNTYHLSLSPKARILNLIGGSKKLSSWRHGLLTDSGGFQMVSLSKISSVDENGVTFTSPYDSTYQCLLKPEDSIFVQNSISSDIAMQLDDVVPPTSSPERIGTATARSIRWLKRCLEFHQKNDQYIFPIIQGGLDKDLRSFCIQKILNLKPKGIAIGGLSGGEEKEYFCQLVKFCADSLPDDIAIYCMGIGYLTDIIICVASGIDLFDCVFPTRTARFGNALTIEGHICLKHSKYSSDFNPIEYLCECIACKSTSRSYIHFSLDFNPLSLSLISAHNVHFMNKIMKFIRESILQQKFELIVNYILFRHFKSSQFVPKWIFEALKNTGINIYDFSKHINFFVNDNLIKTYFPFQMPLEF